MVNGIEVTLSGKAIREIGKLFRENFTSEEVSAFLLLYQEQLQSEIQKTIRTFLRSKLGDF
jgi:hypothetical protein